MFDPTNDSSRFDDQGPESEAGSDNSNLSSSRLPSYAFVRQNELMLDAMIAYSREKGARYLYKNEQLEQIAITNKQLEWAISAKNDEAIDPKSGYAFVRRVSAEPDQSLLVISAAPVSSEKEHFVTPLAALHPRVEPPQVWSHIQVNPFCHSEFWSGVIFEWRRKGLRIHPLVSDQAYEQALEDTQQVSKEIEEKRASGLGMVSKLNRSSVILGLLLREVYAREDALFGLTGLRQDAQGTRFSMGVVAIKSIASTSKLAMPGPLEEHVHRVEVERSPLGLLTSRWLDDSGIPFGLN